MDAPMFPLEAHSKRWCVEDDAGARLRYGDIQEASNAMLRPLDSALGSRKGLVFLCLNNTTSGVAAYLGLQARGHATLLLDGKINPDLLDNLVNIYDPDAVIFPDGEAGCAIRKTLRRVQPHPDLAVLLSTSGSTGSPKLACFSKAQLMANARSIAEYLAIGPDEIPFLHLPLHYSYGLSVLHSHLVAGALTRVSGLSMNQREFWQAISDSAATSFPGVPLTYQIMKRLRFPLDKIASIATLTQAGGRLAPDLVKEFGERATAQNRRFIVMYGQTEAGPRITYLPPEKAVSHAGSIGIPIPGVSVSLDPATGEMICHSPSVMMGYARTADDLQLGDRMGGVLSTGDIAKMDHDGYLTIVGRSGRFLKIHGSRVNLDDVESILARQEWQGVCVGHEDLLFVVLEASGDVAQVKSMLNETLKISPSAIVVHKVDSLPRNAYGKVQYAKLLEQMDAMRNG